MVTQRFWVTGVENMDTILPNVFVQWIIYYVRTSLLRSGFTASQLMCTVQYHLQCERCKRLISEATFARASASSLARAKSVK